MPKARKSIGRPANYYDLNKPFISAEGERYTQATANHLALWVKFNSTISDEGPNGLSPSYDDGASIGNVSLGQKIYPAMETAKLDDGAKVTSTDGHLSFTTLSSGGTPTSSSDMPFTISIWFKLLGNVSDIPKQVCLLEKASTGTTWPGDLEWRLSLTQGGNLYFRLTDAHAYDAGDTDEHYVYAVSYKSIKNDRWYHVMATYDGRGGSSAGQGITLFINGAKLPISLDGHPVAGSSTMAPPEDADNYVGMKPDWARPASIGGTLTGTGMSTGTNISEVAIWKKALTDEEARAVYIATSKGAYKYGSGYLNNPSRVFIKSEDNATGSYPLTRRSGDHDRPGALMTPYYDQDSVVFASPYAEAKISFKDIPRNFDTITLIDGAGNTKTFEFTRFVTTSTSNIEVDVGRKADVRTPTKAAQQFLNAVQDSSLKIDANAKGIDVFLTQNIPGAVGNTKVEYSALPGVLTASFFTGGSEHKVSYPTSLTGSSRHISDVIISPNVPSNLDDAYGRTKKGVADVNVRFTPGENISPFDESRILLIDPEENVFYKSGSNPAVIPGFDQKLASKTIIRFDIDPVTSTDVYHSTGTVANASGYDEGVNSGLSYYNWITKKWDIVGNLSTGSNVDFRNHNINIRSATPHAFIGLPDFWMTSDGFGQEATALGMGKPHSTYGFPFASQFDNTEAQAISISDKLSEPFLLEKVSVNFSASFASWPAKSLQDGPLTYNFFLMKVDTLPAPISITMSQDLTGSSGGRTTVDHTHTCNIIKDLIWVGEISRVQYDRWDSNPRIYGRDLTILGGARGAGANVLIPAVTSSFRVEAPTSTFAITDGLAVNPHRRTGDPAGPAETLGSPYALLTNKLGHRNFAGIAEGRSFIRGIASGEVKRNFLMQNYDVPEYHEIEFDSPYLIKPDDKLVLGFGCQPIAGSGLGDPAVDPIYAWSEANSHRHVVTLSPGSGSNITLYGSFIKDSLPVPGSLNQPLTSNAIHESILGDTEVRDQHQVEPSYVYGGSYISEVYDGNMKHQFPQSGSTGNVIQDYTNQNSPGIRGVYGKFSNSTMGTTGSLFRGVSLVSENERYYDSMTPTVSDIWLADNRLLFELNTAKQVAAALMAHRKVTPATQKNNVFPYAFPFEPRYTKNRRTEGLLNEADGFIPGTTTTYRAQWAGMYWVDEDDYDGDGSTSDLHLLIAMDPYVKPDGGSTALLVSNKKTLDASQMLLFGAWDTNSSPHKHTSTEAKGDNYFFQAIDTPMWGFKYGLINAYPHNSRATFRHDRYGQFRDMLEQRKMSKYHVSPRTMGSAVFNRFFDEDGNSVAPEETHAQNLSFESTSSYPYYDLDGRERDDKGNLIYLGKNRDTDPDDIKDLEIV